jgi:hypothetical protein
MRPDRLRALTRNDGDVGDDCLPEGKALEEGLPELTPQSEGDVSRQRQGIDAAVRTAA